MRSAYVLLLFGSLLLMAWIEEPVPLSDDFTMDAPLQSPPADVGGTFSVEETADRTRYRDQVWETYMESTEAER